MASLLISHGANVNLLWPQDGVQVTDSIYSRLQCPQMMGSGQGAGIQCQTLQQDVRWEGGATSNGGRR